MKFKALSVFSSCMIELCLCMLCILDCFLIRVFKKPPEKENPNQMLALNRKHGWRGRKSDQLDPTSFNNDGAII